MLLLLGLTCLAARAEPPRHATLPFDAARSQAAFTVKVLWLIGLHGEFGAVRGNVTVDHFRGTARVHATIATDDLRMRSRHYETWARSSEFFDARHFPHIAFDSEPFPLARLRDGGPIEGGLTLRGITRAVRFELLPSECKTPLRGACAVLAEGDIQRSDFGMHSHRHAVADKVALRMRIFVTPTADAAS